VRAANRRVTLPVRGPRLARGPDYSPVAFAMISLATLVGTSA
jgi:hypothetical protein